MAQHNLFQKKPRLYLDGGMGTMLQKSGMPAGEIPEKYNIEHPEQITAIHKAFLAAGSDIVYANTFGANRLKMKKSGYSVQELISAGIACGKAATAGTDAMVALDIGPIGQLLEPLGTLKFEEAYDIFREEIEAGTDADLIVIETMTDLYETKAAVLAAKEHSDKPVFVTMTFEENGRTFTGCTVSAMALTLEGLGVDVNCSLGPKELLPVVEEICRWTTLPVIVKPNAGLPDPVTGAFSVLPDDFAEAMAAFAKLGVSVFGGCCGTTPEHLAAAYQKLDSMPVVDRPMPEIPPAICSPSVTIPITEPRIIGERINPTGKKRFQAALKANDIDYILEQAVQQTDAGADIFDGSFSVAVQHFDCDEIRPGSDTAVQSPACLAASGSNPGDVGSVAVVIVRLAGGRKDVMPSDDAPAKVRMWGDSAVEYGDAAPCPIDMRPMCIRGFDDFTDTIHTKSRLLPFCFSIWKGQERCDCCLHRVKDVL